DLCMAAELVTPEGVNFMASQGRGLVCLTLTRDRMRQLGIPLMVPDAVGLGQQFGASIEARHGVSTGISAADRATTIQAAIADHARPDDVVMPGHIFPIVVRDGGVLVRAGLAEASVDLARLAGCKPAAAVCAILDDHGNLAGPADLEALAGLFGLPVINVADVAAYRLRNESLIHRVA